MACQRSGVLSIKQYLRSPIRRTPQRPDNTCPLHAGIPAVGPGSANPGRPVLIDQPIDRLTAFGPLPRLSGSVSNVTFCPSSRPGRPEACTADMWTKTSF